MKSISQDQVNFYNRTGYLIVDNVLSQDEIKELGSITDTFVEKSKNITEHNEDFDIEPGHSKENPKLRRIKKPEKQHPIYEKTLKHSGILDVVEDLIGPNIRTLGGKLNMKAPGGGAQVEWHTDWAFYPHTNDDLIAIGIYLEDCYEKNGPLKVIPGSHKLKIFDHHQNGYFVGKINTKKEKINTKKSVSLVGAAGSVTFHHVRTLHSSALNLTKNFRPLLLYGYSSVDSWPVYYDQDSSINPNINLKG